MMSFISALSVLLATLLSILVPTEPVASVLPESEAVSVVRVVDGDTIVVSRAGVDERVRYVGVDTPELAHDGAEVECFAEAAAKRNEALVAGKNVELVTDVSDRDRYGRLLRYVYVDGVSVGSTLVEEGLAKPIKVKPDTAQYETLRELASEAKAAGRGMWGECY